MIAYIHMCAAEYKWARQFTSRRAASLDAFRTSGFSALLLLITCICAHTVDALQSQCDLKFSTDISSQHEEATTSYVTSSEVPAMDRACVRVVALLFLRAI